MSPSAEATLHGPLSVAARVEAKTVAPARRRLLRIVTRCASLDEFIAFYGQYADERSLFVHLRSPDSIGREQEFAILLRDGTLVMSGRANVSAADQRDTKRAGLRLEFLELDEPSSQIHEGLLSAQFAEAPTHMWTPTDPSERPRRVELALTARQAVTGVEQEAAVALAPAVAVPAGTPAPSPKLRAVAISAREPVVPELLKPRPTLRAVTAQPPVVGAGAQFPLPGLPLVASLESGRKLAGAPDDGEWKRLLARAKQRAAASSARSPAEPATDVDPAPETASPLGMVLGAPSARLLATLLGTAVFGLLLGNALWSPTLPSAIAAPEPASVPLPAFSPVPVPVPVPVPAQAMTGSVPPPTSKRSEASSNLTSGANRALAARAPSAAPVLAVATRAEAQPFATKVCTARVRSKPSRARVVWDGMYLGKTPLDNARVPCGPATVVFRRKGYDVAKKRVKVASDAVARVTQRLKRSYRALTLVSKPPGATFVVNGRKVGKGPTRAYVRSHRTAHVKATLPGYLPWSSKLRVRNRGVRASALLKKLRKPKRRKRWRRSRSNKKSKSNR